MMLKQVNTFHQKYKAVETNPTHHVGHFLKLVNQNKLDLEEDLAKGETMHTDWDEPSSSDARSPELAQILDIMSRTQ